MPMPVEVRAEIVYQYLQTNFRKHISKRDLSNATGIPINELNERVMSKVRKLAEADGLEIPSAMGTGLYILTDNASDFVQPMMAAGAASASYSKLADRHAAFIEKHMGDFSRREQTALRKALKNIRIQAAAADSSWEMTKELYRGYEREKKAKIRAEVAESKAKAAAKAIRSSRRKIDTATKMIKDTV